MKKLIFALFALATLVSCSDDDNKEIQKFATSITMEGDMINLTYDDKKNLKTISEDGDIVYAFTYNSNNELLAINDEEGVPIVTVLYTNGQLSGYTSNGQTQPITYDAQTGKYTLANAGIEASLAGRDLAKLNVIGGNTILDIAYKGSEKGPFYSVPTKNTFLLSMFLNLYYFVSTKPILSVAESGTIITTDNTYDADGYVTTMVLQQDTENQEVIFTYSEL